MRTLLRWLVLSLVRLYYPVRLVEGRERIPAGGPVLFVANHPNGLLDPMLLRLALGRPVRFLAKSTLFGNPVARFAMETFGSLPVYRAREAGARAGDPGRNEDTFARCRAALRAGEAMALFPEGTSHSDPQLKPMKTGAARIALSAEKEAAGGLGVLIVPVGLVYERKTRFRSRVLLVVGQARGVAHLLPDYDADERGAVAKLTQDIGAALDALVAQAESQELLAGIARVARWTAPDAGVREDLGEQAARARTLGAAYQRLRERDPARVEAVSARAREYGRILARLGVRDPWALEVEPVAPTRALGAVARLALALPVAAAGAALSWLPYRLAGQVAGRVAREEDVLGTTKMLAGAAFCLAAWLGEAAVAGLLLGWPWALATLAAAPATGYAALRFEELWGETAEAARHLWLRGRRGAMLERLAARRRALADDVAAALRDR